MSTSHDSVSAALLWIDADPLDNKACDEAHAAMCSLPEIRAFWPLRSAPPHILDNAAAHILGAEVKRLREMMLPTAKDMPASAYTDPQP